MANIELVVKVPEEIYKASQIIGVKYEDVIQIPLEVIKDGTPLPKRHGDLIDINEITAFKELECNGHNVESLDEFTVIIEADKKSESKELYTKVKDTSENHYYKENNDNSYPGYLCNEDGSVCR